MNEELDVITLRGLSAVGHHGVYEFERSGSQVFSADLTLYVDTRKAAQTDSVEHTVDYSQIAEDAVSLLTGTPVYLLETLAERLAQSVLTHPLVQAVEVTVHKPMAPVHHQFSDVSVTLRREREATGEVLPSTQIPDEEPRTIAAPTEPEQLRGRFAKPVTSHKIVLALGSNIGDSRKTLTDALEALIGVPGVEVDAVSSLYQTRPVLEEGMAEQPNYSNAIVVGRTTLTPEELLTVTQQIESAFGRVRDQKWQARTLDIDIVDFGGQTRDLPQLTLPHPRAAERAFVLLPWAEVEPEASLPGKGSVAALADAAADRDGVVSVLAEWYLDEPEDAVLEQAQDPAEEPPARVEGAHDRAVAPVHAAPSGHTVAPVHTVPSAQPGSQNKPGSQNQPVVGDSLYQALKAKFEEAAAEGPQASALPKRTKSDKARPDAQSQDADATEDVERTASKHAEPNLPDWRQPPAALRILDNDTEYELPPAYRPRRTVVRPTPTGAISLPRGRKER